MDEKTIPLNKLPVDVKVHLSTSNRRLDSRLDYRALFEQTGECVFLAGLDFRFITANPQALKLLGYQEEELMGIPVGEVLSLRDASDREMLLGNNMNSTEQTLKKKDGTILPVELSISVVHDQQGMPAYIQMLARDITERKQNERALKRHMRAHSVIGEVTASLFRSTDLETKIPEVLESLGYAVGVCSCVIFGLQGSAIEVKYQWLDQTISSFNVRTVLEPFAESFHEIPDRVFSVTDIQTGDLSIPSLSLLAIPIQGLMGSWGFLALLDKDDHLSWLPTIFDIVQTTANLIGAALERVNSEETLRMSERRNRIMMDALPDLLIRVDLSGHILDYNANTSHPLYLARGLVIGKTLYELWPGEVVANILGYENRLAFVKPNWVEGFRLNDAEVTYESRLYPISANEALIIVRDVTEQARLNQMKSDFINRASHELRTPITSAILMTELIQQGGTKEELDEYWRALTSELNRQKDLINQLLTAGRLESGTVHMDAIPMDLIPTLEISIQSVKPIAGRRNIPLNPNFDQNQIMVLGDNVGLQQVFINLLGNAVKFSPEGKSVDVFARVEGGEAVVSITDHGLGIPPDAIPHLFERFYRAKNVTLAEIPGSGIGLYIVKSIVQELGGSISVQSRVNRGTTFTVRLRITNGQTS